MESQSYEAFVGDKLNSRSRKASRVSTLAAIKPAYILSVLIIGLYIAGRLWGLTDYSLGYDEITSLIWARYSWSDLFDVLVYDAVHPPLFYVLLKLWIGIGGESLLWLKLFPVVTATIAIIPLLLLCRELKLRAAETNLALLLMAVNGYLIHYAQELRMYSLSLCFTLFSLWLFVRYLNWTGSSLKKPLLALFAANLLLIYSHYYGWLVIGTQFVILLLWNRRKLLPYMIAMAGLILCFGSWAFLATQAAVKKGGLSTNLWYARPRLHNLFQLYVVFSGPFYTGWIHSSWKVFTGLLALVLFLSPVAFWAWQILRGDRTESERQANVLGWLSLFALLPVVFSFAVSYVLPHSVFSQRYLIIAAAPYMLLVAVAVYKLRPNWVRAAAVFLIVGWAALSGFKWVTEFGRTDSVTRINWEVLVSQMISAEPLQSDGITLYADSNAEGNLKFHLREANEGKFQVVMFEKIDDIAAVNKDHFWVGIIDPKGEMRELQELLISKGYRVGEGFREGRKVHLFPVWRQ